MYPGYKVIVDVLNDRGTAERDFGNVYARKYLMFKRFVW